MPTPTESSLRQRAKRLGLKLVKSRTRTIENPTFGTYGLVDANLNCWVVGDSERGYGFSLEQIADALNE